MGAFGIIDHIKNLPNEESEIERYLRFYEIYQRLLRDRINSLALPKLQHGIAREYYQKALEETEPYTENWEEYLTNYLRETNELHRTERAIGTCRDLLAEMGKHHEYLINDYGDRDFGLEERIRKEVIDFHDKMMREKEKEDESNRKLI